MKSVALLVSSVLVACAPGETARPVPARPVAARPTSGTQKVAVADPGCDVVADAKTWRRRRRAMSSAQGGDALSCTATQENLAALSAQIGGLGPKVGATPWDRKSAPKYLDLVGKRYGLDAAEKARLGKDGFAVFERLAGHRYDAAYRDIHRSQLPVYVTVDSILHAVFVGHDRVVADLEHDRFRPLVRRALREMHCALPTVAKAWPDPVLRDVDLYLTVARALLGEKVHAATTEDVAPVIAAARQGVGVQEISLFGRPRVVDFTRYLPRGHYADPENGLEEYFRAMAWLSLLELNLVSRSSRSSAPEIDPRETPREAVDALALSELAERAGVLGDLQALDDAYRLLAGKREDVSLGDLAKIRHEAQLEVGATSIEATAATLRARLTSVEPTVATHYTLDGVTRHPVVATTIAPRLVPDVPALAHLGAPAIAARRSIVAADVGFALGHDRARTHLAKELVKHPTLSQQLPLARQAMAAPSGADDLYDAWLAAVRGLASAPAGTVPSFARTEAHADLRLASALAGYGQIRHANVLLAAQVTFSSGCEIPDGWVEEAPATWDALVRYADRGAELAKLVDADGFAGEYFQRLRHFLHVLRTIQQHELDGRALTEVERRFLSMVAEILPGGYTQGTVFQGWYYDLLPSDDEAKRNAAFVADYATGEKVSHLGVSGVRLGLFVVDAGGPPRVMVGPVAATFEAQTSAGDARLVDADVRSLASKSAPWETTHVVRSGPTPAMKIVTESDWLPDGRVMTLRVISNESGAVVVEPLDHHRQPLARLVATMQNGQARIALGRSEAEVVRVTFGGFRAYVTFDRSDAGDLEDGWLFGPDLNPGLREDGTWSEGHLSL